MKYIAILIAVFISAFLSNTPLPAQDSIRNSIPDSIRYAAFDTNVIKGVNRLSNTSEVFSYNEYIWSDKRNLAEIMELRNGFRVFNRGFGQLNNVNDYMFSSRFNTPIYRDGFILNTIDPENISINEIDSIELVSSISSYLYTNTYSTGTINIISKDVIQPEAFSQLRYSQDRYNSLFADVYFSQSFSRKFNLQLGLTKGSSDGRYQNSDYDKWQTRTKLNFFFSPDFNIRASFYFNKIERGLFGGLENDSTSTVIHDSLRQTQNNYHVNAGLYLKLFRNKNNLTNLIFSYIKGDTETTDNLNSENNQYCLYNINLIQNFFINISNNIKSNLIINGRAEYEKYNGIFDYKLFSGFVRYDVYFNNFDLSAFFKQQKNTFTSERWDNYSSPGMEINYKLVNSNDFKINLYGGVNYSGFSQDRNNHPLNYTNFETGFDFFYNNLFSRFRFRRGIIYNELVSHFNTAAYENFKTDSYNANVKFKIYDFVFNLIDDYYIYSSDNANLFRANIFYENKLFDNNLDLKTGFIIKQYTGLYFVDYTTLPEIIIRKDLFNVDFYIGARIGSANVNFTLANLFNRFNYDTYLYPYDDRGGFANVVSRFTIVWDFLN